MRKQTNMTPLQLAIDQLKHNKLDEQEAVNLAVQINLADNPTLQSELFPNKEERSKNFKRLLLFLHPDKCVTFSQQNKQTIYSAYIKASEIKFEIESNEQLAQDREKLTQLKTEFSNYGIIHPEDDNFSVMQKLEHDIFITLMANNPKLSNRSHQSLVNSYGKVLQYLIHWGAEYQREWITSNMGLLSNHCMLLANQIERAGAAEAFEAALKINIQVRETSIGLIGETIEQDNQRKLAVSINRGVNVLGAAATVGIAAFSGPLGWMFLVTTIFAFSQVAVSEKREQLKNKDRSRLYEALFIICKEQIQKIFPAVKKEIKYAEYQEETRQRATNLKNALTQNLQSQRNTLLQKPNKEPHELKLLCALNKRLNKEPKFFTQEERGKLESLGILVDDIHSEQEANKIRTHFLENSLRLSNDRIKLLQNIGAQRKTLTGVQPSLLLTNQPSSALFNAKQKPPVSNNNNYEGVEFSK